MHFTKKIGRIYGEMTPEQCPHSSQLLLKLPENPNGINIQEIFQEVNKWRVGIKK